MKILVVNDYEPARYATGRVLRENQYDVVEAADGAEALAMVRSEAPDLVLLDVNLPDIDGFEVCRRLRADGIAHYFASCPCRRSSRAACRTNR